jgi:O-methyltransferase
MTMFVRIFSCLCLSLRFLAPAVGREYGIGPIQKIVFLFRLALNKRRVPSLTGFVEQLLMTEYLFNIPRSATGVVVECGTYMGGTTVNLSLACEMTGRQLYIFDSFEGFPEPSFSDRRHRVPVAAEIHCYEKGGCHGPLEAVRDNIAHFGKLDRCRFFAGFFEQTLPQLRDPIVFAYCDVDLIDSLKTCLTYLWPRLEESCPLFTHEAHHIEIAGLFFDSAWWAQKLNEEAPGLIGGGSGLGLSPMGQGFFGSCIGYAIKKPKFLVESLELGLQERRRVPLA